MMKFINTIGWTALTAVAVFKSHAHKRGIYNVDLISTDIFYGDFRIMEHFNDPCTGNHACFIWDMLCSEST